ncbi:hypothetical protein D0Z03_000412 [Geotrichum reessii]|nr:hypothetical protein D0Z03_001310 [Galactomyces reessii]KAF5098066.1 hypothetical protein D0Z03_001289 [Galactomyces reessii]KAF5102493.1 hypothetical protein D0Z03_000412 [Galactomyces reessii]
MSNPPVSFSKFPSVHVLTDKKSYRRWLNRVRYYLSRVNSIVPLYILDNQISSIVDPSQHTEFISICNTFFSDCLTHLVSEDILDRINDEALFGKDAFDWIHETFGVCNKFDVYFAIKECYGKLMTDNTDVRTKAGAFINDMSFGYSDLTTVQIRTMNTLVWFNNDTFAMKYLESNTEIGTPDKVKEFYCEWAGRLNYTASPMSASSGTPSPILYQKKEADIICPRCSKPGHTAAKCMVPAEKCPGLQRMGSKQKGKPSRQLWASVNVPVDGSLTEQGSWFFDCAASCHACCDLSLMSKIREESHTVSGVGGSVTSTHIGTVEMSVRLSNGSTKILVLTDVLYIPDFGINLVCWRKTKCQARLVDDMAIIDFADGTSCDFAHLQPSGLLKIDSEIILPSSAPPMHTVLAATAATWHQRLAHASKGVLSKIKANLGLDSKSIDEASLHPECKVCIQGKSTMAPFHDSTNRATRPLERLHTDVSGPKPIANIDGSKYFVTIIDEYTRYTFVELIKTKGEVKTVLIDFINRVENYFSYENYKVSSIRSDNGGEYIVGELANFCALRGIDHQFTVPRKPEQNGLAERMNRTLTEKARCLLIQASLTEQLWGEAILTAAFIHNRIPTRTHSKAPFALWSGSAPGLKHVRIFGCYASVVIAHELRKSKFQPVVNEGIFIGYSRSRKAYRVLLKDGTITEDRDVVFDEKLFPGTSTITGFDNDVFHQTASSGGGNGFAPLPDDTKMLDAASPRDSLPEPSFCSASGSIEPEISLQGEEFMCDASDISDGYFPSDRELEDAPLDSQVSVTSSNILDGPVGRYDDTSEDDMPLNVHQSQQPIATCTTVALRNNECSLQPISSVILPNPMAVNGVRTFDERDSDTDETPPRSKPITAPEDDIELDPGVYHRGKLLLKDTPDIVLIAAPPITFNQAMRSLEKDLWHDACVSEYNSLMENDTWVLVPKPIGRKIVGCKWVFKVKENTDGSVDKYKARLVAQGFSQSPGIDYQETFAPVVRYETVRFLFAVSAQLGFFVHHMDVTTAFLNGPFVLEHSNFPCAHQPRFSKE